MNKVPKVSKRKETKPERREMRALKAGDRIYIFRRWFPIKQIRFDQKLELYEINIVKYDSNVLNYVSMTIKGMPTDLFKTQTL